MLVMHLHPQINRFWARRGSKAAGFKLLVHQTQVGPGLTVI